MAADLGRRRGGCLKPERSTSGDRGLATADAGSSGERPRWQPTWGGQSGSPPLRPPPPSPTGPPQVRLGGADSEQRRCSRLVEAHPTRHLGGQPDPTSVSAARTPGRPAPRAPRASPEARSGGVEAVAPPKTPLNSHVRAIPAPTSEAAAAKPNRTPRPSRRRGLPTDRPLGLPGPQRSESHLGGRRRRAQSDTTSVSAARTPGRPAPRSHRASTRPAQGVWRPAPQTTLNPTSEAAAAEPNRTPRLPGDRPSGLPGLPQKPAQGVWGPAPPQNNAELPRQSHPCPHLGGRRRRAQPDPQVRLGGADSRETGPSVSPGLNGARSGGVGAGAPTKDD